MLKILLQVQFNITAYNKDSTGLFLRCNFKNSQSITEIKINDGLNSEFCFVNKLVILHCTWNNILSVEHCWRSKLLGLKWKSNIISLFMMTLLMELWVKTSLKKMLDLKKKKHFIFVTETCSVSQTCPTALTNVPVISLCHVKLCALMKNTSGSLKKWKDLK